MGLLIQEVATQSPFAPRIISQRQIVQVQCCDNVGKRRMTPDARCFCHVFDTLLSPIMHTGLATITCNAPLSTTKVYYMNLQRTAAILLCNTGYFMTSARLEHDETLIFSMPLVSPRKYNKVRWRRQRVIAQYSTDLFGNQNITNKRRIGAVNTCQFKTVRQYSV